MGAPPCKIKASRTWEGQCLLWSGASEGGRWLTGWAGRTGGSGFRVILPMIFTVGLLLKITCHATFNIWFFSEWDLPSALYTKTLRVAMPSVF